MTIVNWFIATRRPRQAAGAISAMYIGERFEARPIASPPITRQTLKAKNESTKAVPIEETRNSAAANTKSHLRPRRSLSPPQSTAPNRQPTRALAMAQPSAAGVWTSKNRS